MSWGPGLQAHFSLQKDHPCCLCSQAPHLTQKPSHLPGPHGLPWAERAMLIITVADSCHLLRALQVPSTVLRVFISTIFLNLANSCHEVSVLVIPISQRRKLRLKEVTCSQLHSWEMAEWRLRVDKGPTTMIFVLAAPLEHCVGALQ